MVFRPFLRRHFPFLLGDYSRYKKAGPQGTYDGPSGPNSRSEYKAKVTTSSSNSRSAGRSWFKHSTKGAESDDEILTPNGDVELGSWPKNHQTMERSAEGRTVGRDDNGEHMAFGDHPAGDGIMKTVAVRVK